MTQTTGIRWESGAATKQAAGASLRSPLNWQSVNWKRVNRNVRRLQRRIVQAQQKGQKRKVRALQFILTRGSFDARCLAVRRVTENSGKRTPGVDGITFNTPQQKSSAVDNLKTEADKTQPLRRILIPKKNGQGKERPLGIPTMQDRAQQALHLAALDPIAETTADPNSYGFRKQRSVADATQQVFNLLCRKTSAQWVLEADIHRCFDEISHEWLLTHIPMDRALLQRWLKAGFIYQQVYNPTDTGTPQGGVISPVLMNLTLNGLENILTAEFPARSAERVKLVRYADDFIITGKSPELLREKVQPLVAEFLKERGLRLSEAKTRITQVKDGFDFLGSHIQKHGDTLLIKPSRANVRSFLENIKSTIRKNLHTPPEGLLAQLNPKIRGWTRIHQGSVSKEIFNYVDHRIFCEIERWMRRRHPNKGLPWCYEKYYTSTETRQYVFQATTVGRGEKPYTIRLLKAADVPIKRHIKIKAQANPYDPEWETYFEERIARQMKDNYRGYKKLVTLWHKQKGKCPQCAAQITQETGWHLHHQVWRVNGGDERLENLRLMHPTCHLQLHAQSRESPSPNHCTASSDEGV